MTTDPLKLTEAEDEAIRRDNLVANAAKHANENPDTFSQPFLSSLPGFMPGQPHLKVLPRGGLGDNFRPKPLVFVFSACFPLKCLG